MQLLSNKNAQEFLIIHEQQGDQIVAQFVDSLGNTQGKSFTEKLSNLLDVGWNHCNAAIAIGLEKFRAGETNSADVSYALHQIFPLGRKIGLPNGQVGSIASYANTHADGYYMYLEIDGVLQRLKMNARWRLLPSDKLLALPYYPAPFTKEEKATILEFDQWAGGY
ncbi:hypothetical protein [Psychromonas sp. Urea-02u-13]|uniref:hypothetical protein n=1 Tax=Psychromonas sp. Urea-02u-13 TaxID=2058326 RepID=UPI000C3449E4|nr:hypothetical protein [Psychromonas sp. Urea-02u-13]PKG40511.1 hypothetical protein CXF74_02670 [Psychromonas sp. Urea-02u-13]